MVKVQSSSGVEELLRAAEYLDNWDREREHGYAAVAPRSSSQHGDSIENCGSLASGDSGLLSPHQASSNASGSSVQQSGSSALARACGSHSGVIANMVKSGGRRRRHSASGSSSSSRRLSTSSSSPDQKVKGSGKESVQNGFVRSAHNELEKSRRASMRGCLEALRHLLPTEHLERTSTGKNTTLSVLRSARSFIKALHDCLDQKVDTRAQLMSEQTKKLHRLSMLTGMVPSTATSCTNGSDVDNMKLETLGTAAVAVAAAAAAAAAAATGTILDTSLPKSVSPHSGSSKVVLLSNSSSNNSVLSASNDQRVGVTSFDGSPPVSVIKPGSSIVSSLVHLGNNQNAGKVLEKVRSLSESSTLSATSKVKHSELDSTIKSDVVKLSNGEMKSEGVDFHVVNSDAPSARLVFVSPVTGNDESMSPSLTLSSAGPRVVTATLRR